MANTPVAPTPEKPPGVIAINIVRQALKGSLATLDRSTGHPYASLVTLATEAGGTPILLISRLALHTQNLAADARASILCDATSAEGDPLAGGRLTLMGTAERTDSQTERQRFISRHPSAAMYSGFADFAFFRLRVERAHFIGGFGRIVDLSPADLLIDESGLDALGEHETEILQHMNEDHADAVALYATRLAGAAEGNWRMTGIDPDGFDLVGSGQGVRIGFSQKVTNPALARQELVRLAAEARAKA